MGKDTGAITSEEKNILTRVFTLNDKTVGEVMIPVEKMIILEIDLTKEEILKKILRETNYASEDDKIDKQLRRFQRNRIHQAVVLNKEGEISGLITLEDILEELVGSIRDEHDSD